MSHYSYFTMVVLDKADISAYFSQQLAYLIGQSEISGSAVVTSHFGFRRKLRLDTFCLAGIFAL